MAEGHSILRWARALHPLIGKPPLAVEAPRRWSARAASRTIAQATLATPSSSSDSIARTIPRSMPLNTSLWMG